MRLNISVTHTVDLSDRLFGLVRHLACPRRNHLVFTRAVVAPGGPTITGELQLATFQLKDNQRVVFTLAGVDAEGAAVALPADAVVTVASSDTGIGSASVAGDKLTCAADGPPGTLGTFQVTGSAALADGRTLTLDPLAIEVIAGDIVGFAASNPVFEDDAPAPAPEA